MSDLDTRRVVEIAKLPFDALTRLAAKAPHSYRTYFLPDGRRLLLPPHQLKVIQRSLYAEFFRNLSYNEACYCCRGRGALKAAKRHVRHPFLLHLDLESFFTGVQPWQVSVALASEGVRDDVIPTLTSLLTAEGRLPAGAPTSVSVGNLVLRELDLRLTGLCRRYGLTYTRYVDDLAISGGARLERFVGTIRRIVADCGWSLNRKGGLFRERDDHRILGIIAGPTASLDPVQLEDLQLALELLGKGELQVTDDDLRSLDGKISWVTAVDPNLGRELRRQFRTSLGRFGEPLQPGPAGSTLSAI